MVSIAHEALLLCTRSSRFVSFELRVVQSIRSSKLIFLGEIHGQADIIQLQTAVLRSLISSTPPSSRVNVFLEHFSLEQQTILDRYVHHDPNYSFDELVHDYKQTGEEGHDLLPYQPLLSLARDESEFVRLVAAFVPRRFARSAVKDGCENALKALAELKMISTNFNFLPGSEDHYRFFESLISGQVSDEPTNQYRRIFPAQVLKDSIMADIISTSMKRHHDDRFLVVLGSGHCDHCFGVPERVMADVRGLKREEICLLTSRDAEEYDRTNAEAVMESLTIPNFNEQFPGDFVFFFGDQTITEQSDPSVDSSTKNEIVSAYDEVASTASRPGDLSQAREVMKSLAYTDDQIIIAGDDAYNYQGVGNPHTNANIRTGESVLDIGSGLGIDSFIACSSVGDTGRVIGVDISNGEVVHANKRAQSRGLTNLQFVHAYMENLPLENELIDCVISNGAFCLAIDKEKSFREVFRVLKPGGRFSIACTTLRQSLDKSIEWPVCMRVFMYLSDAEPMLERVGFENILVDTSDSLMTFDEPESSSETLVEATKCKKIDDKSGTNKQTHQESARKQIHGDSAEFEHLSQYDMNELCARVVLCGSKPFLNC